jgi:hypothetical protein
MFELQFEIEINTLHERIAKRSNGKELSFQNLKEFSSLHLISKSNGKFTMALF